MVKYKALRALALLLKVVAAALLIGGAYVAGGFGVACIAGAVVCFVAASAVLELI